MRPAGRLVCALLCASACGGVPPESGPAADAASPSAAPAARPTVPARGTFVDFQWAVEPEAPGERALRLEAYLEAYDPTVHGLEDAVHARFYRIARYRLVQAYYRSGRLAEADSALAVLEASDLEVR